LPLSVALLRLPVGINAAEKEKIDQLSLVKLLILLFRGMESSTKN